MDGVSNTAGVHLRGR
jgi:hypothetical protein